jgi:endonuclease/exonuclease/phosphatase family metal-dependent hydrolase
MLPSRDTLDVFVCHFPSRAGGTASTASYRRRAAERLYSAVDSLFACRRHPQVVVTGDFNGNCRLFSHPRLHHLLEKRTAGKHSGSYKYRGHWELIDHILVSDALLAPDAALATHADSAEVLHFPFLLEEDRKYGGTQPFRTYNGARYHGGYSDHLPVSALFRLIY